MIKPDKTTDLPELLVRLIARRARAGDEDAAAVARQAYEELAVVLIPLVSQPGFEALAARAFQLAQREYPAAGSPGDNASDVEPFTKIGLWLDRQDQEIAIGAAAALFASFAGLLIPLIGESLTTRYLQKAWPDGFSRGRSRGRRR